MADSMRQETADVDSMKKSGVNIEEKFGVNTEHTVKSAQHQLSDSITLLLNGELEAFIENTDRFVLIGVCAALFAVLLMLVFVGLCRKSSRKRSVLLLGLSDSGKTLLFSKLVYRKQLSTQTSIKENAIDYNGEGRLKQSVKLVDIPGHDKLRHPYVDKFKTSARAIIFVVDSLTFQKEIKDVAEYLYTLLTDASLNRTAPAVLIACNKQDQALAKGAKLIQSQLEKELQAARKSKLASLSGTDNSGKSSVVYLGKPNQDFSFNDVKQFRIEFLECSARGGKDEDCSGISAIEDWIARVA